MTEIVNRVLDKETLAKLAKTNALGFTEDPNFKYVPIAFKEKDKETDEYIIPKNLWPVFKLRGKNSIESAKLEDNMGYVEYDDKNNTRKWIGKSGTAKIKIVEDGVKGWDNWYDSEGKEIVFRHNNGKIHKESVGRIHSELLTELANAITERHTLTPEELEGLEY